MESLNLEAPRQLGCKGDEQRSKRRRINDVSNLGENVSHFVTLLKSESKPAPFSTLFNKNSSNVAFLSRQNSVELLSVKANCDSKQSQVCFAAGKENSTLEHFDVPRSPRRLSLITEKSADERLSLRKSRAINGSETHRRSSSHFVEDRG